MRAQSFEIFATCLRAGSGLVIGPEKLYLLEARLAHISTPMSLSIIGCVVNGPGEARETDIGFTGGGNNTHQVYLNGNQAQVAVAA